MSLPKGNYVTVRLGNGCPWGFRLQGGEGTGKPLTVSKVRRKSRAYNKVYVGDIVIQCNGRSCDNLTYSEVMVIADKGGPNLTLLVYRPDKVPFLFPEYSKSSSDIQSDDRFKRVREEDVTTEYRSKITKKTEGYRIRPVSSLPHFPKPFWRMSDEISETMDVEPPQLPNEQPQHDKKLEEVSKSEKEHTETVDESLSEETSKEVSETKPETNAIDSEIPQNELIETKPEKTVDNNKTITKEIIQEENARTEKTTEVTYEKDENTEKSLITQKEQTVAPNFTSETTSTHMETKSSDINSISEMFNVTKFEKHSTEEMNSWMPHFDAVTSSSSIISSTMTSTTSTTDTEQDQHSLGMNTMFTDVNRRSLNGFNPKVYQPPKEADDMELSLFTRRKKMFSSSSFYEEPNAIYPTVEEQVELCRKIADSLSSDKNKKSRGANMFFGRVKKSHKWIHEGPDPIGSDSDSYELNELSGSDSSGVPYIQVSKGPPKLKLILDPRQLQDMVKLRSSGQNINEHNVVSPDICLGIVKDLNSPTGKGALLFAKRKKKSEEWIVDEEKVKSHLRSDYTSHRQDSVYSQKFKTIKSPWEAAMESPYGRCDAAFVDVHPDTVAETVIKVAEEKSKFTDTPAPSFLLKQQTPTHPKPVQPSSFSKIDPYRPRAPRGWSGTSDTSSFLTTTATDLPMPPPMLQTSKSAFDIHEMTLPKYNFQNFNTTPKAWTGGASTTFNFKTVKPPSLLIN